MVRTVDGLIVKPDQASNATEAALLETRELARAFGETQALVSASLAVHPGTIHALAGENGSGKSTLVKLASGVLRQDSGDLLWRGHSVVFSGPAAARKAGVSTVYQETLIVEDMTVRDNVLFGTQGLVRGSLGSVEGDRVAHDALDALGLGWLDLRRPAWTLSLAERQIVTIARGLALPWKLLILDESTSALDSALLACLFAYLRRQRDEGKAILFTSHRMNELAELADVVTVLRLGETVGTLSMKSTSAHEILELMAGRAADAPVPDSVARHRRHRARPDSEAQPQPILRVESACLAHNSTPVDLSLYKGEVLGLAGLEGQGQVALAECMCGLRQPLRGRIVIQSENGEASTVRDYRSAHRRGLAFVPRNRKEEGMFLPLSTGDNFSTALVQKLVRFGLVRRSAILHEYEGWARRLRTNARLGAPVTSLSGGTQQKVLLARWLAVHPRVLVMNDALRGVDANTKNELYPVLLDLADEGLTIVLVSTEIAELLTLCDRIAVFHDGAMSALMSRNEATESSIVAAMFGHAEGSCDA